MSAITNIKKSFGERLKQIRKSLSYNQEKMAAVFGLSRESYAKKEIGDTYPGYGVMRKLAVDYNISMDWLLMGRGPMRFEDREDEEKAAARNDTGETGLTPEKRELLEQMAKVPLLNYELMAYYHRFKLENKELFGDSAARPPEEE